MASVNKVILVGNVGRDPEVRYLDGNSAQGGQSSKVATFTLATTEKYRDRNGNLQENTEWHNIVAWRNSADVAEKFIRKGSQLFIEGRLRTRSWADQSGVKKYTTEIVVDNLQLLGRRPEQDGGYAAPAPAYQPAAPAYQQSAPAYQQSAPAYQQPAPAQSAPAQAAAPQVDNPEDDFPF